MKTLVLVLLFSSSVTMAQTSLIPKQKEFNLNADKKDVAIKAEPCAETAAELLKKLEKEKKKKELQGKALNLQGGNSAGCSID